MNTTQWILVVWIALSGLVVFGKGCAGTVHRYTLTAGILALIECGIFAYLVTRL